MIAVCCSMPISGQRPVRIMPLGDSMTNGTGSDTAVKTGWRLPLYQRLIGAGYFVDFVGNQAQDQENGTIPPAFDWNHQGMPGWRTEEHKEHIYEWLTENPADVILLMIGTNNIGRGDAPQNTIIDYALLLDEIDRWSTDTHVIVAKIPQRRTYSPSTTVLNGLIGELVQQRIQEGDKLTLVDMESITTGAENFFDPVHVNGQAYRKMANVWFDALVSVIPQITPSNPSRYTEVFLPIIVKD